MFSNVWGILHKLVSSHARYDLIVFQIEYSDSWLMLAASDLGNSYDDSQQPIPSL